MHYSIIMRLFPAIAAVSSLSRPSAPVYRRNISLAFLPNSSPSRHHRHVGGVSATLAAAAILPPSSSLRATSSDTTASTDNFDTSSKNNKKPIPTILLAGFLGSGKTTTLKHLLENNQNVKIGTIVNDVASVNIDAKLVSNSDSLKKDTLAEGVIELQNGCACCSLADELFTSVVRLTEGGKRELDAIVVELSGVADPVAVRDNWEQAKIQGHPATQLADLKRTVTLVDACTFGTDWMTWDIAGDREKWVEAGDDCAAVRKVPELLAEQVEAADLLLVNKIDLAGDKQVKVASGVARGLNENALIVEVQFGQVNAKELLGKALGGIEEIKTEETNSHDHSHDHSCNDTDCDDPSHDHSHSHSHSKQDCNDPECSDSSHSHSHSHEHSSESCNDPECNDPSHSHSHSHDHQTTAADQLGISSFVYRASVPFNSQRLLALLNRWPIPIKDTLDFGLVSDLGQEEEVDDAVENKEFAGVLRSKGFCWMAPTKWSKNVAGNDVWRHDTAMHWSHAGKVSGHEYISVFVALLFLIIFFSSSSLSIYKT